MIYELLIAQLIAHFTNQLITWQCISIGIYLGGLGLGAWRAERREKQDFFIQQKFLLLETHLSLLGAILISFICGWHIIYRTFIFQPLQVNEGGILLFALVSQIINFFISYWAGMEIPIIARLWESAIGGPSSRLTTPTTSISFILGISYFGAFCGSALFSLWLFPQYHYAKTAMIASLFNFIAGFIFLAVFRPKVSWRAIVYFMFAGVIINFMIPVSDKVYFYSLQNYYYGMRLTTYKALPLLINRILLSPPVQQIITPVQTIDLVTSDPLIDSPFLNHQPEVRPYHLYLDQRLQHSSMNEYSYHETMSHVPLQLNGKIPHKVLVLGAGDGLLLRELLKYPEIEEITLIEIDKDFLELAENHPLFYKLNKNSLKNPKVKVVVGDAYYYTRETKKKFDAIFADFPWPFQYDLAKLYSVEFYRQLKAILGEDGFLVLDFPILDFMTDYKNYIAIMKSTLKAAGFARSLILDLNKESFIFAKLNKEPLHFSYQKREMDISIPIEDNLKDLSKDALDLETVALDTIEQNNPLSFPKFKNSSPLKAVSERLRPEESVNSIFRPVILNIKDPRF